MHVEPPPVLLCLLAPAAAAEAPPARRRLGCVQQDRCHRRWQVCQQQPMRGPTPHSSAGRDPRVQHTAQHSTAHHDLCEGAVAQVADATRVACEGGVCSKGGCQSPADTSLKPAAPQRSQPHRHPTMLTTHRGRPCPWGLCATGGCSACRSAGRACGNRHERTSSVGLVVRRHVWGCWRRSRLPTNSPSQVVLALAPVHHRAPRCSAYSCRLACRLLHDQLFLLLLLVAAVVVVKGERRERCCCVSTVLAMCCCGGCSLDPRGWRRRAPRRRCGGGG
jgi:hypothetical protein